MRKITLALFFIFLVIINVEAQTFKELNLTDGIYVSDFEVQEKGFDPAKISSFLIVKKRIIVEYDFFDEGLGFGLFHCLILKYKIIRKFRDNLWIVYNITKNKKKVKYIEVLKEGSFFFGDFEKKDGRNVLVYKFKWIKVPKNKETIFRKRLSKK